MTVSLLPIDEPTYEPGRQRRVLFFAPFGAWLVHNQVDAMLGKALALRGAQVTVARCRGVLRQPAGHVFVQCGITYPCAVCAKHGDSLFESFGVPQVDLADFIHGKDSEDVDRWAAAVPMADYATATYRGLPLGEWATSQLLSIFRMGLEDLEAPVVEFVARGMLLGAYLSYVSAQRLIETFDPDSVVIFNARLYPYHVPFVTARRLGKDVMVHERALYSDGFAFVRNDHIMSLVPLKEKFVAWRDVPMTASDIQFTDDILARRRFGGTSPLPGFYDTLPIHDDTGSLRRLLGVPDDVTIIGCFTSSHDEAWHPTQPNPATLQLTFLETLFEAMRGRPEWLIVRHHPNIGGSKIVSGPEGNLLARLSALAERAPDNVRVIMPNEEVTSYNVFDLIDAAIVVFSSIGLEVVTNGIPAIGYHYNPYTEFPSICLKTLERAEIGSAIDRVVAGDYDIEKDMAYAYRFYFNNIIRHAYNFNNFRIKDDGNDHIELASDDEILPGRDVVLDHICDHLMYHTPLYHYPTLDERRRSNAEEQAFIQQKRADLATLRRRSESIRAEKAPEEAGRRVLVLQSGGAAGRVGNRHPDIVYCPVGDDLRAALQAYASTDESFDAYVISLGTVAYDLTALLSTAGKLAESPAHTMALLAAWKRVPGEANLFRLPVSADALSEQRTTLDAATFVSETLPRVVWSASAFRALTAWAAADDETTLADRLADGVLGESILRIDRPRLLIRV